MVRKYKQKGQINYTEADLYNAVEAVKKGQLSQRAAADVYGVPDAQSNGGRRVGIAHRWDQGTKQFFQMRRKSLLCMH